MDKDLYQHFILTRFNAYWPGKKTAPDRGIDEEWLSHRMKIFKKITIPSIESQSCDNFVWLVKCHHLTPQWARDELNKHSTIVPIYDDVPQSCKNFCLTRVPHTKIKEMEGIKTQHFKKYINKYLTSEFIITTRLDSDDGLSRTHVETIQDAFDKQAFTFIDFFNGASIKNNVFFKFCEEGDHPRPSNFVSLIEKSKNFRTVLYVAHPKAKPCTYLNNDIGWLECHHDKNIINGVNHKSNKSYSLGNEIKNIFPFIKEVSCPKLMM